MLYLTLILVSYLIVEEENVGQYYPDFAFDHPLFSEKMRIHSNSKISRFLKSVTKEQISGFLDDNKMKLFLDKHTGQKAAFGSM
ncbi:MAG: hypothetical protein LUI14_11260 [Lachnospiraceae bacterium]|nr:hypothetical protein [Lachnospiraceae bacterium]